MADAETGSPLTLRGTVWLSAKGTNSVCSQAQQGESQPVVPTSIDADCLLGL